MGKMDEVDEETVDLVDEVDNSRRTCSGLFVHNFHLVHKVHFFHRTRNLFFS